MDFLVEDRVIVVVSRIESMLGQRVFEGLDILGA